MDLTAFEKIVRQRRSIRIFDGSPIPESVMEKCFDLALLAPNSSNLQPWEFHWVREASLREKLAENCLGQSAARTAAELVVCVARTDTWQKTGADMLKQLAAKETAGENIPKAAWHYYRKLVPIMYQQGWLSSLGFIKKIIFFLIGLKKPMMREPTSHHDLKIWAIKSTALACENLMLAATAQGYDSCPMEGMDSTRIRKLLNFSRASDIVMVIAFGKRAANGVTLPQIRGDRSQYVIQR